MLNFKGLRKVFSTLFVYDFSRKNVSHVMPYQLTKFHCLIAFSSPDIGQHVY